MKGIEPEAREAAKQAARRAGMTLGTWLNQVIMETGTDEVWHNPDRESGQGHNGGGHPNGESPARMQPRISQPTPSPQNPGQSVDLSPVAEAVRQVLQRVEQSDQRTHDITHRLEQSVAELSQRLERKQREPEQDMSEPAQTFNPLERKLQQLTERLEETERSRGSFGKRAEDKTQIQTLEKTVTTVVDHLENAEKKTEQSLEDIRKILSGVVSRVEEQKIEEQREEARNKTQALEANFNAFANRLEKMEHSVNSVGGQAVEAALKAFAEKTDADQHKATIAALQQSLNETTQRLERIENRHTETLKSFEGMFENIARRIEDMKKPGAVEARLDEVSSRLAQNEDMTLKAAEAVERAIADMSDSLHKTDTRTRETANAIQNTIERISKRLARVEKQARSNASVGMPPQMPGAGFPSGLQGFPAPAFDMPAMAAPFDTVPNLMPEPRPMRAPSFSEPPPLPETKTQAEAASFSHDFDHPPMMDRNAEDQDADDDAPPFNESGDEDDNDYETPEISNPAQETAAAANDFLAAARRAAQAAAQNGRQAPPMLGTPYNTRGYGDAEPDRSSGKKKKLLIGAALGLLFVILSMAAIRLINTEPPEAGQAGLATDVPGDMEASTETSKPVATSEAGPAEASTPEETGTEADNTAPSASAEPAAPAAEESPYVPVAPKAPPAKPSRAETIKMPPNEEGPSLTPAPAKPVTTKELNMPTGQAALLQAAQSGNAAAQYRLGQNYADGDGVPADLKQAAFWYGKAAAQGLAIGQYRLATLYEKGRGVAQDNARAQSLYEKAAAQGNIKAMHNLAVIHAEGRGVSQDFAVAAKWFGMAASYGLSDSQYNLGILLQRGLGVPQNPVEAYKWFAIGANAGDKGAAQKRDEMEKSMDAAAIAKAKAAALAWRPRPVNAAANGAPSS